MTIGIDIDGVLTDLEEWQFSTGSKFTTKPIKNPHAFDVKGIFDLTEEEYNDFLNKYLTDYSNNEPARKYSSEVIKRLRKDNNEIIIITGRFHTSENTEEGNRQRKNVYNWLKNNNIEYDKIIFTGPHDDKLEILRDNNVEFMIEDKSSTINTLSKHMKVMCFNAIYNSNCKSENIHRVYSWWDIYNYFLNKKGE